MTPSDQMLILILGDQLSLSLSSLRRADKARDTVLMAEVMTEVRYARHHKKKFVLVFSAMRHFAEKLRSLGWRVDYVKLHDEGNTQSLAGEVERALKRHKLSHALMTEAGEYRLQQQLQHLEVIEDTRFICSRASFRQWAAERKEMRMEYFYRDMRRQTGLLMEGDKPCGGKWNYDSENRKPAKSDLFMQAPPRFAPDQITQDSIALTKKIAPDNFGDVEPFWFAVTAEQAEVALQHFLTHALPQFGETQDAMLAGQYFLNHAVLSPYINLGLLDPLEICRRVEKEYRDGRVPLSAAEGFIRQIIGWREFVRGIYMLKMPEYIEINALKASRPIPDFYWSGKTEMNCIHHVVKQTQEEAYAHHIQRLMVTGNFALLAGIDPIAIHEWYLAVYADAYEWVELPNTYGMALHADGGLLGSKPYAASGNYINKMSDYCGGCKYDVKQRTGPEACPFNALYWNFIATHQQRFAKNPRMANICRVYDKFDADEKQRITKSATTFLESLEPWQV